MDDCIQKVAKESLLSGESLSIPSPHAKNYNRIVFQAALSSLDGGAKLVLSHGKTCPWCSAYVEIDAEAVSVYEYPGKAVLLERIAHGLSVLDFIHVSIDVAAGFSARLDLSTASGSFSKEFPWNGSNGDILAEVLGTTLSDCTLAYAIDGVRKDTWAFGDSYLDFWCRRLIGRGLDTLYLDGHSGRTSRAALASLKTDLSYATPKRLVWLMGMNDPDGEAVSPSWIECYHELCEICRERGIELILATIPNTPIRCHQYKNETVRSSGFRYLDINAAVGADADSGWREGLLSPDRVHPTAEGAEVIAEYILAALPEMG